MVFCLLPYVRSDLLPRLSLHRETKWAAQTNSFVRRVGSDGCVEVAHESYYIGRERVKQQVSLFVNAPDRIFDVFQGQQRLSRLHIKRLHGGCGHLSAMSP
jgi:hypothetical protein